MKYVLTGSDIHKPADWLGGQSTGTFPGCFPRLSTTTSTGLCIVNSNDHCLCVHHLLE